MPGNSEDVVLEPFWSAGGWRRVGHGTEGDIIKAEEAKSMPGSLGKRLMEEAGKVGSDARDEWANRK